MDWLRRPLDSAIGRAKERLTELKTNEAQRAKRKRLLETTLQDTEKVDKEFKGSTQWGEPFYRSSIERVINEHTKDIDRRISGLKDKDDFDNLGYELEQSIDELNEAIARNIKVGAKALHGMLRSRLSEAISIEGMETKPPSPDAILMEDPTFGTASVMEAVQSMEWKSWWGWRWKETQQQNVEHNKNRVAGAWSSTKYRGQDASKRITEQVIMLYQGHIDHLIEELHYALLPRDRDESSIDDQRIHYQEIERKAQAWVKRVDDLNQRVEHYSKEKGQ